MRPAEIDAMQAHWAKKLDDALEQVLADYRGDKLRAGKSLAEIDAEIASHQQYLDEFRRARRQDIRTIIVGARYGSPEAIA